MFSHAVWPFARGLLQKIDKGTISSLYCYFISVNVIILVQFIIVETLERVFSGAFQVFQPVISLKGLSLMGSFVLYG